AILSETYEEGNEEKLKKWITVMKEIACGYDAVAHLSEEEKEAFPYVILSNQFIATAWFAGKEKFQSIFEVNVKMTNWILQNIELMKL
ncbi:MAG: AraC family transcriptional regulator, partial [Lachnospiraceae bacterium]|nr:AraC family transcriptional regulator [Lachnospiraceae bacterium]